MLKAVLLSTAALALVATSVDARPMLSPDGKISMALPHSGQSVPASISGSGYVVSTIDRSKVGAYFCCNGETISGPSSLFGKAYGIAEQFVPTANATVSKIVAAIGYVSGDHNVTLTLYADNGNNSPGKILASGAATSTTEFGSCCALTKAKINSTNLTAGTPVWIAITAGGTDYNVAPFQVNNEVNDYHYVSSTSNGGSTWGTGFSETEYNPAIALE